MYPYQEIAALVASAAGFGLMARADLAAGRRRQACLWLGFACLLCVASMAATVARHCGAFERPEKPIPPAYLKPVDGRYEPPLRPTSELFAGKGVER